MIRTAMARLNIMSVLAGALLVAGAHTTSAASHGHDHFKLPDVEMIKNQLINSGNGMRGAELELFAKEKRGEMIKHVHATHAHDTKYGQISALKSPLPPPKDPISHVPKDLSGAHTLTIRRAFNKVDTDHDGFITRNESLESLYRRRAAVTRAVVSEYVRRQDLANIIPPQYFYIPKKHFDAGVNATYHDQLRLVNQARGKLKELEESKPEASNWTKMEREQYDRLKQGIKMFEEINNLPNRIKVSCHIARLKNLLTTMFPPFTAATPHICLPHAGLTRCNLLNCLFPRNWRSRARATLIWLIRCAGI